MHSNVIGSWGKNHQSLSFGLTSWN